MSVLEELSYKRPDHAAKIKAVGRLLNGESLDTIAKEHRVSAIEVHGWRRTYETEAKKNANDARLLMMKAQLEQPPAPPAPVAAPEPKPEPEPEPEPPVLALSQEPVFWPETDPIEVKRIKPKKQKERKKMTKSKHTDVEKKSAVHQYYIDEIPTADICEEFDITKSCLYAWNKKYGAAVKKAAKKLANVDYAATAKAAKPAKAATDAARKGELETLRSENNMLKGMVVDQMLRIKKLEAQWD